MRVIEHNVDISFPLFTLLFDCLQYYYDECVLAESIYYKYFVILAISVIQVRIMGLWQATMANVLSMKIRFIYGSLSAKYHLFLGAQQLARGILLVMLFYCDSCATIYLGSSAAMNCSLDS